MIVWAWIEKSGWLPAVSGIGEAGRLSAFWELGVVVYAPFLFQLVMIMAPATSCWWRTLVGATIPDEWKRDLWLREIYAAAGKADSLAELQVEPGLSVEIMGQQVRMAVTGEIPRLFATLATFQAIPDDAMEEAQLEELNLEVAPPPPRVKFGESGAWPTVEVAVPESTVAEPTEEEQKTNAILWAFLHSPSDAWKQARALMLQRRFLGLGDIRQGRCSGTQAGPLRLQNGTVVLHVGFRQGHDATLAINFDVCKQRVQGQGFSVVKETAMR
jgi:hypothetical protein